MAKHAETELLDEATWPKYCDKLVLHYRAGKVAFEEYVNGVVLAMVAAPEGEMQRCANTVPLDLVDRLLEYLDASLLPVDFMPCPRPFMVDAGSEEVIEEKKRLLRPKYIRLYELVKGRLATTRTAM